MTYRKWIIGMCLGFLAIWCLSGCATTSEQKLYMAERSYTTLANVATTLRAEGVIPDDVWATVKKADKIAWAALEMYRLSVENNQPDPSQLDAFNQAVSVIRDETTKILKKG